MRTCTSCGQDKPVSDYGRLARGPGGLNWKCRACVAKYMALRRLDPKELEKNRAASRRCQAEARRDPARAEILRRRTAVLAADPVRRKKAREATRDWVAANPERAAAACASWTARNRDRIRESAARRKALLRAVQIGPVSYAAVRAENDGRCHVCLFAMGQDRGHVDHVVPISKGGPRTQDNLRLAHSRCNQRKWNHLMEELDLASIRAGAWRRELVPV